MNVLPVLNLLSDRLRALPVVVLYITDGCNSRCITCDIWKLPRRNMAMPLVEHLASEFRHLGVQQVALSGGEAMQHPEWPRIASLFRSAGAKVSLLTNGLLLRKQSQQVIESVDTVTLSLDGATAASYAAIRGVDALPVILEGMRAVSAGGVPITTRTTVQRLNFRELPQIVDVALAHGASQVSFLAVDVANAEAFGPRFQGEAPPSSALSVADLPEFVAILDSLAQSHAAQFAARTITESPAKLRRLVSYFEAVNGLRLFEGPACNAPHLSTVIEVDGSLRPCFFLPTMANLSVGGSLREALNSPAARALRQAYRSGERSECARCVCPLYRGARALARGFA